MTKFSIYLFSFVLNLHIFFFLWLGMIVEIEAEIVFQTVTGSEKESARVNEEWEGVAWLNPSATTACLSEIIVIDMPMTRELGKVGKTCRMIVVVVVVC